MNIPKNIKESDWIGRAIFSSGQMRDAMKGIIQFRIFYHKSSESISVDRLNLCPDEKLIKIQNQNAQLRSTSQTQRRFYGWAQFQASTARRKNNKLEPAPTKDNPYHAEIIFSQDILDDRYKKISFLKELASNSVWRAK